MVLKRLENSAVGDLSGSVLFVEGGADDIAYDGGLEGYTAIAQLNVPVLWFSKALGHGGDLFAARGGTSPRSISLGSTGG
jgi:hypothetical protein